MRRENGGDEEEPFGDVAIAGEGSGEQVRGRDSTERRVDLVDGPQSGRRHAGVAQDPPTIRLFMRGG